MLMKIQKAFGRILNAFGRMLKAFGRMLKAFGHRILLLLKKNLWYILLLIGSSIYVYNHWSNVNDFEKFNVTNLIFVIWLLLLLLPLFSEMELFGIRLKKEVEKIKQETKEDVKELRHEIQTISIAGHFNNQISFNGNLSLPNKESIEEAKSVLSKENNVEPSKQQVEGLLKGVTDSAVFLFQVRLVLEDMMYKLAVNCGYNGGKALFPQILDHLSLNEYLNHSIKENLKQVRIICNRGVHGEIVSDEYLDYVREAFPVLVSFLDKALHESVASYTSCRKCGYNGPSRYENICPKCRTANYE